MKNPSSIFNTFILFIFASLFNAVSMANDIEDNDTFGMAGVLAEGISINGYSNDEDWFLIDFSGGRLEINLTWSASDDLDLYLYNSDGTLLSKSNASGNVWETITLAAPYPGVDYYLKVETFGAYANALYQLTWFETSDDIDEPNDGPGTNVILPKNTQRSAISYDQDWYKIQTTGGDLEIDLTFLHANSDLNLYLYDSSGSTLLGTSNSQSDDENISKTGLPAGEYYVFVSQDVSLYNGTTYGLIWSESNLDDSYEPNNDISTQATLAEKANAFGISNDEDWYKITTTQTEISAVLAFNNTNVDFTFALYDVSGNELASSTPVVSNYFGNIIYSSSYIGDHFIKVISNSGYDGDNYTLSWSDEAPSTSNTADVGPNNTTADVEPNNTTADASPLTKDTLISGTATDIDNYQIDVTGDRIIIDLLFSHAISDLDMFLLHASGEQVVDSATSLPVGTFSSTDNEQINIANPGDGIYYIMIMDNDGYTAGTSYQLRWSSGSTNSDDSDDSSGGGGSLGMFLLAILGMMGIYRRLVLNRLS